MPYLKSDDANEKQTIVVRYGRRELTISGYLNDLELDRPYYDTSIDGMGVANLGPVDSTATLKLSGAVFVERWVHDEPHIVDPDRHGKRDRCECKCSQCFKAAQDKPCICPECRCNA